MNRFRLLVLIAACGSTFAAAPAWTAVVADSGDPTVQYLLKDVVVTSCAASGTQRTLELRGHVTLIK